MVQKNQGKLRKLQSSLLHIDIPATHLTKTITQVQSYFLKRIYFLLHTSGNGWKTVALKIVAHITSILINRLQPNFRISLRR